MLTWFVTVNRLLRDMEFKARDALDSLEKKEEDAAKKFNGYLRSDLAKLERLWAERGYAEEEAGKLGRHIAWGERKDYEDILEHDLPKVHEAAERHALEDANVVPEVGFEDMLHPIVRRCALQQYRDGHLREAVLNAFVAIFDIIRRRTKIDADGVRLIGAAFSIENPRLIFSELETESGQNDQKGFIQILQGAYQGVRNPKAHSLQHDLDRRKAAEYLIFASLLARRVAEAGEAKPQKTKVQRKTRPRSMGN